MDTGDEIRHLDSRYMATPAKRNSEPRTGTLGPVINPVEMAPCRKQPPDSRSRQQPPRPPPPRKFYTHPKRPTISQAGPGAISVLRGLWPRSQNTEGSSPFHGGVFPRQERARYLHFQQVPLFGGPSLRRLTVSAFWWPPPPVRSCCRPLSTSRRPPRSVWASQAGASSPRCAENTRVACACA